MMKNNILFATILLIGLVALTGVVSATITEYAYGTASTSNTDSGSAALAFNNNNADNLGTRVGGYLQMDYGAGVSRQINRIGLLSNTPGRVAREFYVQGSDDATSWTTVLTVDNTTQPAYLYTASSFQYFNFVNPTGYRYYRIYSQYSDYSGRNIVSASVYFGEVELLNDDDSNRNNPQYYITPSLNTSWAYTDFASSTAKSMSVFKDTTVQFNDDTVVGSGAITNYYWDFNGDGTIDSTDENPTYSYSTTGQYNCNLTTKVNSANVTTRQYINVVTEFENPLYRVGAANVASASSTTSGTAEQAFNRVTNDKWQGNGGTTATPSWIQQYYTTPRIANTLMINTGTVGLQAYHPISFNINASNDGTNWTTVYSEYGDPLKKITVRWATSDKRYYNFSNTNAYSYYRLNIINTEYAYRLVTTAGAAAIGDMDFGYADPRYLYPTITVDSTEPTMPDWATYTIPTLTVLKGTSYKFNATNSVNTTAISSYAWDMTSDGSTEGTTSTFDHTFDTVGLYTTKLTIGDGTNTAISTMNISVVLSREPIYNLNIGSTASSTTLGSPNFAFDGSNENQDHTSWYTTTYTDAWLKQNYGRQVVINEYEIRAPTDNIDWQPRAFRIEASNNDADWTVLEEESITQLRATPRYGGAIAGYNHYVGTFANTNAYQYYRITYDKQYQAINTGVLAAAISEMRYRYHDPSTWLEADAYLTGDGYFGYDTYQLRTLTVNQSFSVMAGKSVTFNDDTDGSPTSWQWDVNGDSIIEGLTQDYTYTFNTPGIYYASLVVNDGTRTSTKYMQINVVSSIEYPYWYGDASGGASASSTTNGNANYPFAGTYSMTDHHLIWDTDTYPNQWLQVFYGSGDTHVINELVITPPTTFCHGFPRQFVIFGSNDGSNWTTIDERLPTENKMLARLCSGSYTYNFTNPNSYKYYRLFVNQTTQYGNYLSRVAISGLELRYHDPSAFLDSSFYVEPDGVLSGEIDVNVYSTDTGYTVDRLSVLTGDEVQFKDSSVGSPTGWTWVWDDGTANSNLQNPTHTFTTAGIYDVSLTTTRVGFTPSTKTIQVYVSDAFEYSAMYKSLNGSTWMASSSALTYGHPIYTVDNSYNAVRDFSFYVTISAATPWAIYDYGVTDPTIKHVVNEIEVLGSTSYPNAPPQAWKFEGSNDGSTWTILHNKTAAEPITYLDRYYSNPTTANVYGFENNVAYRYYKFTPYTSGSAAIVYSEIHMRYHEPTTYVESHTFVNRSWISYLNAQNNNRVDRTVFRNELISFNDSSIGSGLTHQWDMDGDGDVDFTSQNATWTYAVAGTYVLNHTVTNGVKTSTQLMGIVVVDEVEPYYGFSFDNSATNGVYGIIGSFTSTGYLYNINDHNEATRWSYTAAYPQTIKYDYGNGNANLEVLDGWTRPIINKYKLQAPTGTDVQFMPKTWTLQASNDDAAWTTLDTQTGVADWTASEIRSYGFSNDIPYQYYKIVATTAKTTTAMHIAEWSMIYTTGGSTVAPTPAFTMSSDSSSTHAVAVQFNDTSAGNPTSWLWDFGDGYTSTSQNPLHWYSVMGDYTINMTATNAGGDASVQHTFNLSSDWDANTKAWLQFNGADASTTITDRTPGNTWVANGGAKLTTGTVQTGWGNASLVLDGNGDWVSSTDAIFDIVSNNLTLELWMKRSDTDTTIQTIVSKSNLSSTGFSLYLTNNKLNFRANQESPSQQLNLQESGTTADTDWHHVVVERRGNTWNMYKDGVSVATATWAYAVTSNTLPLQIGQSSYTTPYNFAGYVDEFRYGEGVVWDTATTFDTPYEEYQSVTQEAVNFPPVASFTVNSQAIKVGSTLTVTDTSTNSPDTWAYVWDDGTANATTKNPTHAYDADDQLPLIQNYTVHQYVSNPAGADDYSMVITSYEFDATHSEVDFIVDHTSAYTGHDIQFTDLSNQSPTAWVWAFGDGEVSYDQNPTHAYSSAGIWTVNLTITSPVYGATKFVSKPALINTTVEMAVPDANFTASPKILDPLRTVYFTDTSGNAPTSWEWDFDGDGDVDSTAHNPNYQYPGVGNYTVSLKAYNAFGNDTETKIDYIEVGDLLPVVFSGTPLDGAAPLAVDFTTDDIGQTGTAWDFTNDGSTDNTTLTPSHTYATPGNYNVSLSLTNYYGTNESVKTNYVSVGQPPVASYTFTKYGYTYNFTDTSSGNPTNWSWDFTNDGSVDSTARNPTYTFPGAGNYTVNFTASNVYGSGNDLDNVTVSGASGWNRQDIEMDQLFTFALTLKDTTTREIIPVCSVLTSNGDNTTTTYGLATFTTNYSVMVFFVACDGYTSTSRSYVIDRDRTETLYLTPVPAAVPTSAPNTNVIYSPKQVSLTIVSYDPAGVIVKNASVELTAVANTLQADSQLQTLYGINPEAANQLMNGTLVMHGQSDTSGTIVFTVLQSINYQAIVTDPVTGTNYTAMLYPGLDPYTIWIGTNVITNSVPSVASYLNSTRLYITQPDAGNVTNNLAYRDSSGLTTRVDFIVKYANNLTIAHQSNATGFGTSTVYLNYTHRNIRGQGYFFGYNATRVT